MSNDCAKNAQEMRKLKNHKQLIFKRLSVYLFPPPKIAQKPIPIVSFSHHSWLADALTKR
jgi:hypothetical protein